MASEPHRESATSAAERWLAWIRLGAVPFAMFQVAISTGYPGGYEALAWVLTGGFALGALMLFAFTRARHVGPRLALTGLVFDALVVSSYVLIYSFETATPIRQLLYLPIAEAALFYGIYGSVAVALAAAPVLAAFEWLREHHNSPRSYHVNYVTFQVGTGLLMALIIGWLVLRLRGERAFAEARAEEAEELRDRLGRRVDLLEAANRAARALRSSLVLDEAFGAFIRELSAFLAFDRVTIVFVEGERAEVMAAAGRGTNDVFPPGSFRPVAGSVLDEVLQGHVVYRESMRPPRYPEEERLLELGLECRLLAPLQVGPRTIGMLGVMRDRPHAFSDEEVELVSLLGRLVSTAVQNIRAYDAERKTVEELRRLSALRADFVSLVSHELRSPMAAVIGAARTLQGRWRELSPEHRQAFLALIADETTRLAHLIADVLDTSRIEAETFSYTFTDVDLGVLVDEVVTAAGIGQDEVRVRADVGSLPTVRGDTERLRQVLRNLVDNAVKYSPEGAQVHVAAESVNGEVRVEVRDEGPGIAPEDQHLIFEKFGRATAGEEAKPGTGLGLFIARSIAEAHGGSLDVDSAPAAGATFRLVLPTSREDETHRAPS
jgi:signal transduction histidine kinase